MNRATSGLPLAREIGLLRCVCFFWCRLVSFGKRALGVVGRGVLIGGHLMQIWDLASGELKLSLTGHISTVRGLAVSIRHPYMFSAGEDKVGIFCDLKAWRLDG